MRQKRRQSRRSKSLWFGFFTPKHASRRPQPDRALTRRPRARHRAGVSRCDVKPPRGHGRRDPSQADVMTRQLAGGAELPRAQLLRAAQHLRGKMMSADEDPTKLRKNAAKPAKRRSKTGLARLLLNRGHLMPVQRILVPVDYSSCSRAALSFAADLAQRYQA